MIQGQDHSYHIRLTATVAWCEQSPCVAQARYDCLDVGRQADGTFAYNDAGNLIVEVRHYCRWHGQCWAQDHGLEAPKVRLPGEPSTRVELRIGGGDTMDRTKPRLHRDGTVTYWSVYQQVWVERAEHVPDRELAAMSPDDRDRVIRHLGRE